MEWICYLLPTFICLKIMDKRSGATEKCNSVKLEIFRFANWALLINLLAMCVIRYILGIDAEQNYLHSFGFATKYIIIALFFAVVLPYVIETIKKYVELTFTVKGKDEE